MIRPLYFAAGCLLFAITPTLFSEEHSSDLRPRIVADFKDGQPAFSVAPGEKRFGRLWGMPGYNKHPHQSFVGKRISLKEAVEQDSEGHFILVPKVDMVASLLGGINVGSGTLAGWFRVGEVPQGKQHPILSVKSYSTSNRLGNVSWQMGVEANGGGKNFYITTPNSKCTTKGDWAKPGDWAHVVMVWDENHGSKIYINGELAGAAWKQDVAHKEDHQRIFSTANDASLFTKSRFSQGTGNRSLASLEDAGNWSDGRVLLQDKPSGSELEIVNEANQRIQMRTPVLGHLDPGQYELVVRLRASGNAEWNPRITLRGTQDSRLIGFPKSMAAEAAVNTNFPFEIVEQEGASVSLDLNFEGPEHFAIEEFFIRPASDQVASGQTSFMDNPTAADRLHIHSDPQGGIRNLQIFDVALSADGVKRLFQGVAPRSEMTEPVQLNRALRLTSLGWENAPDSAFLKVEPGQVLHLKQAPVIEAKENLRAAGWLPVSGFVDDSFPWSYHGYSQGVDRELRLKFGDNVKPNWMVGSGSFQGTLQKVEGEPQSFKTMTHWFAKALDPEVQGTELIFTQKFGHLRNLSFYEIVDHGRFPETCEVYSLQKVSAEPPLPQWKEREFYSIYTLGHRLMFEAESSEVPKEVQKIPALSSWHIVTVPMQEEFFLGKIGLRFRSALPLENTRARIVVHDAISPWRELARLDFLLGSADKGKNQPYTILLDLRETLIQKGDAVWITVTFDREVELQTGTGGTELLLCPAENKDKALASWREWEMRSVRDRIELISEPRPWADVGDDEESQWWVSVTTPIFEEINRSLQVLKKRLPEDPIVQSWYHFTHPGASFAAEKLPLPEMGSHPEWAVLTRECLRLYREFVDFWIDQRQHENGEFGHFYGDDTDLVQDWLDLTLISDPHGKYAESLDRLAHGIAVTFRLLGGKDGISDQRVNGRPILENGLNLRWTDVLHAYEDGLNVQPPNFIAHYGDPVRFQRLLDTVSRYDGFILTPEQAGRRYFAADGAGTGFVNTHRISGSPEDKYWHLLLHAGLVVAWYNQDPDVWSMLEAVAKSEAARAQVPAAAADLLQAVYARTLDAEYLNPLITSEWWKQDRTLNAPQDALYPNTYLRTHKLNREKTVGHILQDASTRYASLGSERLGWADNRHLKNWLEWQLTTDEAHLVAGLRALYRQMAFLMPAYTTAEQSGDRVSIPKQLISQLYLGGVPGSRNRHFHPDFAVSYRGLDDNFAARVLKNTPQSLEVELYSFHEETVTGELLVWALEPGEYKITQRKSGAEEDVSVARKFLKRGDSFPITLPACSPLLVSVEQESRSEEPVVLGDAAVSAETIRLENGALLVPVYNLGVVPLRNVAVRVFSKEGQLLDEKIIETLPELKIWKLGVSEVSFSIPSVSKVQIKVESDMEITRNNNSALFSIEEETKKR